MHCIHEKGTIVTRSKRSVGTARSERSPVVLIDQFAVVGSGASSWGFCSRLSVVVLIVVGALALCATPALAVRGHVFGRSFGGPCSGAGGACEPGQLKEPTGITVNEATGQVYVADTGAQSVERFSSAGVYEAEFNGSGLLAGEGKAAGSGGLADEKLTGRFEEPEGIAVDNTCYLHEQKTRAKLSKAECEELDPSNGDVYVVDNGAYGYGAGHHVLDKYSASGEYLGQLAPGVEYMGKPTRTPDGFFRVSMSGVAVSATGEVLVAAYAEGVGTPVYMFNDKVANEFDGEVLLGRFGSSEITGPSLALDSAGDIYSIDSNPYYPKGVVENFDAEGNPLSEAGTDGFFGEDIEQARGVAVEISTNDVYVDNVTHVARFSSGGVELESLTAGNLANGSGVAVDSVSGRVYVADSVGDEVDEFVLEPPGVPTVEVGVTSVSEVTASSAEFQAEVNPRSEPREVATSYEFQYGRCGSLSSCVPGSFEASVPVPAGLLAANYEVDAISAHLQGLSPRTVYHFRVKVANSHPGEAIGEERVFTTQPTGVFVLPDERGWELVTPPNKHGAALVGIGENVIQAAASGDAITYLATAPTEANPVGYTKLVQVLSARGAEGWSSLDISPPNEKATGVGLGEGQQYRFFSEDLSQGVMQPFGGFTPCENAQGAAQPCVSGAATEQTPYLHSDFSPAGSSDICSEDCYAPLVTAGNVAEGTEFGETGRCPLVTALCGPQFVGASPDARHIVLTSKVPLVAGAPEEGLYEWSAGKLELVSVRPSGQPVPAAGAAVLGSELSLGVTSARGAVSADGSRIVFSETDGEQHLYLRDIDAAAEEAETIQLDAVQGGTGENASKPAFQLAAADGSRVFFTDTQKLKSDSGAAENKPDLYECKIVGAVGGGLKCELTDLTPKNGSEEAADVQGAIAGASENGEYVYFVADSVLADNEGTDGAHATPGGCLTKGGELAGATCNLYVDHSGVISFIAVLSAEDQPDWGRLDGYLGDLTARVSPDGRWLAFMSERSLTGYDNRDAASGKPDEEVFLYDAAAEGGGGGLVCASCNPTGARPHGVEFERPGGGANLRLADSEGIWGPTQWLAANVPGWTSYKSSHALYQSRYLSDSGRLFFNSSDDLVPQATNGAQDVYEYEPPGEGSCSAASATFAEVSDGCIDLISSGTSKEESAFLDASESGDDVFFLTYARLTTRDTDTALDVYDARVGGGESEPPKPVQCEGDACQSPIAAPEDLTPGSLIYSGPGDLVSALPSPPARAAIKPLTRAQKLAKALQACKKDRSKKRVSCEKQAKQKYGPTKTKKTKTKKAKKASNDRRASR